MKRNGTTSNGTTRWRCKICGASLTKQRSDITNAALFRAFIQHLTAGTSLAAIAGNMSCSTRTLQRKFDAFWLVDVPDPTIGHTGRVYDQIFIDGTYTAGGCLIVAATRECLMVCVWEPIPHKEISQNDYCGETRSGR